MRVIGYILILLCGILAVVGLVGSTLPDQESRQEELTINVPALQVWNQLVQPDHMKKWREGIIQLQPHSRFALQEGWTEKTELGSAAIEVIEWKEPRFLVLQTANTSLPWSTRRVFELQESSGHTKLIAKEVRHTRNPYLRLAYRLGFGKNTFSRELSSLRQNSEK